MDRSGASPEPGSPAGGKRRGALHPATLCCTGTRMCCTEMGSKAACACNAPCSLHQYTDQAGRRIDFRKAEEDQALPAVPRDD